jgi:hypothetical protein
MVAGRVDNRPYGGRKGGRYGESLYGRWPFTPAKPCAPEWDTLAPCKPTWGERQPCAPVWTDKPICGA